MRKILLQDHQSDQLIYARRIYNVDFKIVYFFRIDKVTNPLFKNDNLFQAWKWTSNPISKLREKTLSFGLFDLFCIVLFLCVSFCRLCSTLTGSLTFIGLTSDGPDKLKWNIKMQMLNILINASLTFELIEYLTRRANECGENVIDDIHIGVRVCACGVNGIFIHFRL